MSLSTYVATFDFGKDNMLDSDDSLKILIIKNVDGFRLLHVKQI